jgi:hypothetical protein
MLPYLPVQSQPVVACRAPAAAGISGGSRGLSRRRPSVLGALCGAAVLLGVGACGGERYTDWSAERPSVARTAPWSAWSLPQGRTVASSDAGLVVRYGAHGAESEAPDVGALDGAWRAAIEAQGFAIVRDQSRGPRISATYEEAGPEGLTGDGRQLAYALSSQEHQGARSVTVSLQVLPASARVPLSPPAEITP